MNVLAHIKVMLAFLPLAVSTNLHANKDLSINTKFDSLLQSAWDQFNDDREYSLTIANHLYHDFSSYDLDKKFRLLYLKGYIYQFENYYDQAARYYFEALDLLKDKSDHLNLSRKVELYQNLGFVYEKTFQYDNSLKYQYDALKIARELGNKQESGELNYSIAVIYRKKKDLDKAIDFHKKSIRLANMTDNEFLKAKIYNSLGLIYDEKKDHKLARENYLLAIDLAQNNPALERDLAMFKNNLGENYSIQNQYALAEKFYKEALEISENLNDTRKIKWINNNIGDVYLQEARYSDAIAQYKKVIELGNPEVADEEMQRAYKNISEAFEALGDYQLALNYRSKYLIHADQLLALKEDLAEQNAQYRMKEIDWQRELMQKEVLLASVERENFWSRIFLGFSVLALVLGSRFTYVYYRKISKARHLLESI